MTFLLPEFLILFILLPILIWYRKKNENGGYYPPNFLMIQYIKTPYKIRIMRVLEYAIIWLCILLLAKPVIPYGKEFIKKDGIDIAFVLDISQSMLEKDMNPNRLEKAKEVLKGFIGKLVSDRVSIVIFAGKPFVSSPLSFDYSAIIHSINLISTDSIHQRIPWLSGTAIGDALLLAYDNLEKWQIQEKKRDQVIILLSDGEANIGINPDVIGKMLAEKNIPILGIGIGNEKKIDPSIRTLSETTKGKYYSANNDSMLENVFKQLETYTKQSIESEELKLYKDITAYGLIFLIILIILYTIMKSFYPVRYS